MQPAALGSWEQVAPSDVNINLRHLHRLHAALTLTDKPVIEAAHGRIITGDSIDMVRIAFGGTLPADPVIGDVIETTSPLRYDQRMLGGLIAFGAPWAGGSDHALHPGGCDESDLDGSGIGAAER